MFSTIPTKFTVVLSSEDVDLVPAAIIDRVVPGTTQEDVMNQLVPVDLPNLERKRGCLSNCRLGSRVGLREIGNGWKCAEFGA